MEIQANKPVSPLSVMAQHRRYEEYTQGARAQGKETGINISHQTVQRVTQEAIEALIRNIGEVLPE